MNRKTSNHLSAFGHSNACTLHKAAYHTRRSDVAAKEIPVRCARQHTKVNGTDCLDMESPVHCAGQYTTLT